MSSGDINMYNTLMDEMDKISTYLPGCITFIDDGFADVLHWLGGAEMLLSYGVEAIKKFSSFEGGSEEDKNAVVFISTPYKEDEEETINDIISNSYFENMIIFTNVHPAIQSIVRFKLVNDEEVADIIDTIKRNIKTKINHKTGKQGTVDFHHLNLSYSPIIHSNLFVTPSHSSFFPLTPHQVHLLNFRNRISTRATEAPKVDFDVLPKEMQLQYKLLVSNLNSMLDSLRLDEEIFSIGVSSSIIADELASLGWREGRRSAKQKASLLLIDRVLDLATPSHHFYESPLEKIFSSLPSTNIHDVLIDLSMVYSPPTYHVVDLETKGNLYGNLSQASDQKSISLLKSMLLLKQKELASHLNRALTAVVVKEKLGDPGSKHKGIGIDGLVKNISLIKNNVEVIKRNSGLIQLILAFIQSAKGDKSFDKVQKLERVIQQYMAFDRDNSQCLPLNVAQEFLKMKEVGPNEHFPLETLFTLLLHIFSINDVNMTMLQQETLEKLLIKELAKESQSPRTDGLIRWDEISSDKEPECRLVVQEVMSQFKWLTHARLPLTNYKSLVSIDNMTSISGYQPIIKQILNDITNPDSQLPDIKRKTTGLGDILKSGFGFLMGKRQKEAHPLDHPILLVFVVGGVTMGEVKMAVDHFVGKKYNGQILVGSTTILTPERLTKLALFNDQSCLL